MNKFKKYKVYAVLLFILIGYVFLAFYFQGNDLRLAKTSIAVYQQEWAVFMDGNETQRITLPNEIDVDANQTYQLKTTLPQDFLSKQTLLFRSSLQYFKVYLNDELIYENLEQSGGMPPIASMWNTIDLPVNANNKQLVLEIVSPYQVMASQIKGVYYGDLGSIYVFIFSNYGYLFIFSMIIVLLSFSLLVLATLFRTQVNRQNQLLSLFTLLLGLWMVAESRMLQFFVASQFIHAALAYLMLASFAIPILMYIKDYVLLKNKISLKALIIIHAINFVYVLLAQLAGVVTFFETVQTTNSLHVVTIIVVLLFLGVEVFVLKNQLAINFIKRISIVLVAGVAEIVNFFSKNYENTASFLVIGLIIFLVVQIISYLKVANSIAHQSKMAQEFEKLASVDYLTNAKNRRTFDNDISALQEKSSEVIRISFFDVNNLKSINDTLGHLMGDDAIINAYKLINDVFKDIGKTYRLGGDEFACIISSIEQDLYDEKIDELFKKVKELHSSIPYKLVIAQGSALFDPNTQESISDVLSKADKQMYLNKQSQKLA